METQGTASAAEKQERRKAAAGNERRTEGSTSAFAAAATRLHDIAVPVQVPSKALSSLVVSLSFYQRQCLSLRSVCLSVCRCLCRGLSHLDGPVDRVAALGEGPVAAEPHGKALSQV
eukprot:SAG22_NODE_179_length_16124_cov_7.355445_13_plen_117_part_00